MCIQSTKHIIKHNSTKISERLKNVNVVAQTRSEVAGAGSWWGGRVKETGTERIFIKIEGFVQSAFCGILGGIVAKRCVLE